MSPWASGGRRGGRRLAAASYVLDSNCAPLPSGWDWVARALEFNAPDPLIRPLPHGLSAPIPAISESEKHDKRAQVDLGTPAPPDELQTNLDTQADASPPNLFTKAIPEDSTLNLDALIPDRARFGKNARVPGASASKRASEMNQMTHLPAVLHVGGHG